MTSRFRPDSPRDEFAMKTSHDFEDKIELPEFVNLPMDQGQFGEEEAIEAIPTPEIGKKTRPHLTRGNVLRNFERAFGFSHYPREQSLIFNGFLMMFFSLFIDDEKKAFSTDIPKKAKAKKAQKPMVSFERNNRFTFVAHIVQKEYRTKKIDYA